jgi:hypothetical protein
MPRGDRTGPAGMGPMTGRGMGYCAGYSAPGYATPAPGFGLGWGRGRGWWGSGGRGWRHGYYATPPGGTYAGQPRWARYGYPPFWGYAPYPQPPSAEEETEFLKNQAEALRRELEAITQRLEDIEKGE